MTKQNEILWYYAYRPLKKPCLVSDEVFSKYETSNTGVFFYFVLSFRLAILLNKNKIRHLEWIKYQTINKAEAKISVLLIKKLPFFRHRGFFSVNFVYLQNSQQFLWIVTHSTHIHWGFSFLFGPCIFCPFLGVKFIQLRIFPFWIKKKSCWKIQSVV